VLKRNASPEAISQEIAGMVLDTRLKALRSGGPARMKIDLGARVIKADALTAALTLPEALAIEVTVSKEVMRPGATADIVFLPDGSSSGAHLEIRADRGLTAILDINWLTGLPVLRFEK
jgi:general secretion pathway protein H